MSGNTAVNEQKKPLSRVGRRPIPIPKGVQVEIKDHSVSLKGPKGSVIQPFHSDVKVKVENGQILVERDRDNLSELQLIAIDAGAEDVRESSEGLEVYVQPAQLENIKQALQNAGAKIAQAAVIQESTQGVDLTEEQKRKVDALFAELENDEDVTAVHTNANL